MGMASLFFHLMRKSKRDYADLDNRDRIIQAATELFIEKGAPETSLADIAKRLGISKGTLYYYYSAKSDLVFAVTDTYMRHLTERLLSWVENLKVSMQPKDVVFTVLSELFSAKSRSKLHHYLISEAITNSEGLRLKLVEAYGQWKEMLKRGLTVVMPGEGSTEVEHYSSLLLMIITGGIVHTILGLDIGDLDKSVALLFRQTP